MQGGPQARIQELLQGGVPEYLERLTIEPRVARRAARGVWGHAPPRKILICRSSVLLSRVFFHTE